MGSGKSLVSMNTKRQRVAGEDVHYGDSTERRTVLSGLTDFGDVVRLFIGGESEIVGENVDRLLAAISSYVINSLE